MLLYLCSFPIPFERWIMALTDIFPVMLDNSHRTMATVDKGADKDLDNLIFNENKQQPPAEPTSGSVRTESVDEGEQPASQSNEEESTGTRKSFKFPDRASMVNVLPVDKLKNGATTASKYVLQWKDPFVYELLSSGQRSVKGAWTGFDHDEGEDLVCVRECQVVEGGHGDRERFEPGGDGRLGANQQGPSHGRVQEGGVHSQLSRREDHGCREHCGREGAYHISCSLSLSLFHSCGILSLTRGVFRTYTG
jgi:hypothetical protein